MNKTMPIGIQDFKKLRTEPKNFLYIDKTQEIHKLLNNVSVGFLSRPRRFGKSLLLSTIRYLFEGKKDLFEGLWIYDKWNWEDRYPVILISMPNCRSVGQMEERLKQRLLEVGEELLVELDLDTKDCEVLLRKVIISAYERYGRQVVILIDEYDRPILDNIEEKEVAKEIREYLRGFYSTLKDLDEYLKFVLLTGVTRFSRAGIFSGLNNLKDISLDPRFGNIVGVTQAELENYLGEYIKACGVDLEEVREWYNGYNFLGESLYNPFDVLRFVDSGCVFKDYWFSTGTPQFLIKLIDRGNFYIPELSNLIIGDEMLDSFDVESLRPEVVLFQAGYLTIDEVMTEPGGGLSYKLKVPNKEVRRSLNDRILEYIFHVEQSIRRELRNGLCIVLERGDVEGLRGWIERLFSAIPYHYHIKSEMRRQEGYYASVLFSFFMATGFEVRGEDVSRVGRADIVVLAKDKVYIVEIKTDADEPAIKQIEERKYYEKYLGRGKKIYLVGINISSEERRPREVEIVAL